MPQSAPLQSFACWCLQVAPASKCAPCAPAEHIKYLCCLCSGRVYVQGKQRPYFREFGVGRTPAYAEGVPERAQLRVNTTRSLTLLVQ